MKKILCTSLFTLLLASVFAAGVNDKVMKLFKAAFPEAREEHWSEGEGFYQVYFIQGEESCRMRYDEDGNVLSTLHYYMAAQLTPFIKAKVLQKYPDKRITGVTESMSAEGLFYLVVLEDEKSLLQVNADAYGNLQTVHKFVKLPKG